MGLIVPIITVIASLISLFRASKNSNKEAEEVNRKLETIRQKEMSEGPEAAKSEALKRSIEEEKYELFLKYHSQGLSQATVSFWFSLIFASIGFIIIAMGILTVQSEIEIWKQGKAWISLISGTIIDAVSALFFVQSNKARQLMIDFFDKLRVDRKFEESLKLTNEIPDEAIRSKVKTLLSMHFADIKINDNNLSIILDGLNKLKNADPNTPSTVVKPEHG